MPSRDTTTIEVSQATWRELTSLKARPGTSFDDVIQDLLDRPSPVSFEPTVAWDDLAATYNLTDAELAACRAVVDVAADGAVTKQRVLDEVYPTHPADKSSREWWWRSLVNETLADAGVITVGQEAVVRVVADE